MNFNNEPHAHIHLGKFNKWPYMQLFQQSLKPNSSFHSHIKGNVYLQFESL